jgi:hypothetical protein
MQDWLFLTDFVGIPELVNLLEAENAIEQQLQGQMPTTTNFILRDCLNKPLRTSFVFSQHRSSLSFVLCVLSLLGLHSVQLNQREQTAAGAFCKVKVAGHYEQQWLQRITQVC